MLQKSITYTDFNGTKRTEDFFFNLSKQELADMQLTTEGGLDVKLERIVKSNSQSEIAKLFKEIILLSYGEKSDDGRHFIKVRNGVKLAEEFSQSQAFVELYMEFLTNDKLAADFCRGIVPKDVLDDAPAPTPVEAQ